MIQKQNWVPHPGHEALVKAWGITPTPRFITMAQIDEKASEARNHARIAKLDEKRATDLGNNLAQGKPMFYCVVIEKDLADDPTNPRRYYLIDGRHRHYGAKALKLNGIMAYVVPDPKDAKMRYLLPLLFNPIEGQGTSRATAALGAMQMIDVFPGTTYDELAKIFSMRATVLREEVETLRESDFLACNGIRINRNDGRASKNEDTAEKPSPAVGESSARSRIRVTQPRTSKKRPALGLHKSGIRALKSIDNKQVRLAAAHAADELNLKLDQICELVRNVNKAQESEAAQIQVVQDYRTKFQSQPGAGAARNPFSVALVALANTLKDRDTWEQLGVTSAAMKKHLLPLVIETHQKFMILARG